MTQIAGAEKSDNISPLPDPIEFILHEHDRQIEICDALETLISVLDLEPVKARAGALLHFLTADLPLHIEDEELDLFPLLRARCGPSGEMAEVLDQLAQEHEEDRELASVIAADLTALRDGREPSHTVHFRSSARAFCELQRRHLVWENRLVLPLARTQLSAADQAELGQRMIARRAARS